MNNTIPGVIYIRLDELKFHPQNKELFASKSQEFIKILAHDISLHGIQEPISVSPEMVVLSGENRVKAARLLGWETIEGRIVQVADEISYLISRNTRRRQLSFNDRVRIYQKVCSIFFTMKQIKSQELESISIRIGIPASTLVKDIQKIRNGRSQEVSIELLKQKWEEKNLKGVKINLIDTGKDFILKVESRKANYEFGPGNYKTVLKEAFEAASSKYFSKSNLTGEAATLNETIKELRISAGFTQFQLAQKIGYSQSYIAELESGRWAVSATMYEDIMAVCQGDE